MALHHRWLFDARTQAHTLPVVSHFFRFSWTRSMCFDMSSFAFKYRISNFRTMHFHLARKIHLILLLFFWIKNCWENENSNIMLIFVRLLFSALLAFYIQEFICLCSHMERNHLKERNIRNVTHLLRKQYNTQIVYDIVLEDRARLNYCYCWLCKQQRFVVSSESLSLWLMLSSVLLLLLCVLLSWQIQHL